VNMDIELTTVLENCVGTFHLPLGLSSATAAGGLITYEQGDCVCVPINDDLAVILRYNSTFWIDDRSSLIIRTVGQR
jgi:hypothetical protein